MSIGNSGQPAWKTADGTGGWGGDYGPPTAATVAGDRIILGWTGHEAGWGIISTDLSGKKFWGLRQKNASILATDGTRIFRQRRGGRQRGECLRRSLPGSRWFSAISDRDCSRRPVGMRHTNSPGGVAYDHGLLYVSFPARNLIGVYDANSGDLQTTWSVEKPGRLVVTGGAVLAISGVKIVRGVAGKFTRFHHQARRRAGGHRRGRRGAGLRRQSGCLAERERLRRRRALSAAASAKRVGVRQSARIIRRHARARRHRG